MKMDSKILICLQIPSILRVFEVRVPGDVPVRELLPLFVRMAVSLSDGAYVSSGQELLCANRQNLPLGGGATLADYGIGNGDHLTML